MKKTTTRRRFRADIARRRILEAAEKRLIEGGPEAVRVQRVAHDLGITDAAVHHHFGNRERLMEALLRHGGRRLRTEVEAAVRGWSQGEADLAQLALLIAEPYERQGYARLALWLRLSGWRERGSGMLSELTEALHAARCERAREAGARTPRREESLFLVALFHMVQVAEPLFGDAMRRSAGFARPSESRDRFHAWVMRSFDRLLDPERST